MTGMHTAPPALEPPPSREGPVVRAVRAIPPWVLFLVGALVILALIPTSIYLTAKGNASQVRADANAAQVTAVKSQAAPLAGQVQSVCDQGGVAATELNNAGACVQASKVQSVVAGPPGPVGPAGANGRGIASTRLLNGDLVIDYTDGTSADVGTVTGPQGQSGAGGKDGRGITASAIVGQDLVVTYSDGTSSDLGTVVGAAGTVGASGPQGAAGQSGSNGIGVSSVVINSAGHLIVTYTDGSTGDAGPVPQAMACPNGSAPSTTDITEPSGLSTTDVPGVLVCSG